MRMPEPPPSLDRKSADRLTALAEDAVRRQHEEAEAAMERALGQVPRLLGTPVRRILGA